MPHLVCCSLCLADVCQHMHKVPNFCRCVNPAILKMHHYAPAALARILADYALPYNQLLLILSCDDLLDLVPYKGRLRNTTCA